jgi:hypothetical protein
MVLARRLSCEDRLPSVTYVVFSELNATREFGVTVFVLWMTSMCGLVDTLQLPELRRRGC